MSDIRRTLMGMNQKFIPKWFQDAIVCWYDPKRQGCTDASLGKDPRLLDLSGNNRHLELRGFNWTSAEEGMTFYSLWLSGSEAYKTGKIIEKSDHHIKVQNLTNNRTDVFEINRNAWGGIGDIVLKVNTIGGNIVMSFLNSSWQSYYTIPLHTGINRIPALTSEQYYQSKAIRFSADANTIIDIEVLPSYDGPLVFNGTSSYGILKGCPYLQDYTVLVKRQLLNNSICTASKTWGATAFVFELYNHSALSYGNANQPVTFPPLISYQTPTSYNGKAIVKGDNADASDTLCISALSTNDDRRTRMALYQFFLFNRTLTIEEIDWIKYNLMDAELPKPIAHWSAKGKTNQDADKAVLKDLTGNGYDIALHGFAFTGKSGYGYYPADMSTYVQNAGIVQHNDKYPYLIITSTNGTPGSSVTYSDDSANLFNHIRIKVSGINGNSLIFATRRPLQLPDEYKGRFVDFESIIVKTDGVYEISLPEEKLSCFCIQSQVEQSKCNIKIEILPEYPDALSFDGVDDYAKSTVDLPPVPEFTLIMNRFILPNGTKNGWVFSKEGEFYFESTEAKGRINSNNVHGVLTPTLGFCEGISYLTSKYYNDVPLLEGKPGATGNSHVLLAKGSDTSQQILKFAFVEAYLFDKELSPNEVAQFINKNMDTYHHQTPPIPVSYIESDGVQYIDTGVIPNTMLTKVEMKFSMSASDKGGQSIFGAREHGADMNACNIFYDSGDSNTLRLDCIGGTTSSVYGVGEMITFSWMGNQCIINQAKHINKNKTGNGLFLDHSMYLFQCQDAGRLSAYNSWMKLYYCKIYQGNILVRDFIPCIHPKNNKPALYDKVHNTYYYNKGQGRDFLVP